VLEARSPDGAKKKSSERARTEREYLRNEIYPRRVREMGWMRSIYLWESAIQRLAFHPTLASFELANAVTKAAAVAVGEETLSSSR
jgi:hypothetical protein